MSDQTLFWKAIYKDGTSLSEKRDEFQDIDNDRLQYFLLEGQNTEFKHNVDTGEVTINDDKIMVLLNDKLIGKSRDVINFKKRASVMKPNTKTDIIDTGILSYYTGWKEKNSNFDYIEILFWLDLEEQRLKLRTRFTPKIEKATLSLIINGELNNIDLEFEELNKRQEFIFSL